MDDAHRDENATAFFPPSAGGEAGRPAEFWSDAATRVDPDASTPVPPGPYPTEAPAPAYPPRTPTPTPASGDGHDEYIYGEPQPGQLLFGKYLVERKIGGGGMGMVFLVRHQSLGRQRALKMILAGIAMDRQIRARFRREAEIMARLSEHPNAVHIHDALIAANAGFIDMEYVRGKDIGQILASHHGQGMPIDWVARVLAQLCDVLHVAHEMGIVHRDLSPSNLMLLEGRPPGHEHLKVLDFGIAKIVRPEGAAGEETENLTAPQAFLGKWQYASPEQINGLPVDRRSDIYAVGVILFELLTGRRPFLGTAAALMNQHCNQPPPFFDEVNADFIPRDIENVVLKALNKRPQDRHQTALELREEFLQALTTVPNLDLDGSSESQSLSAGSPPPIPTTEARTPTARANGLASPRTDSARGAHPEILPTQAMTSDPIPAIPRGSAHAPAKPAHTPTGLTATELPPVAPTRRGLVALVLAGIALAACVVIAALAFFRRPDDEGRIPPALDPSNTQSGRKIGEASERKAKVSQALEKQLATWRSEGFAPVENDLGLAAGEWPKVLEYSFAAEGGAKFAKPLRFRLQAGAFYLPEGFRGESEPASDDWPSVLTRDGSDLEFSRIAGGTFRMGYPGEVPDESARNWPPHDVTLRGFYMLRREVTNGEVEAALADNPASSRPHGWQQEYDRRKRIVGDAAAASYPAVNLDWNEAQSLAARLGGLLPTESQWEFAARSRGGKHRWPWSPSRPFDAARKAANLVDEDGLLPAGKSRDDCTVQTLYDMAGNAREWCRDLYRRYPDGPQVDPFIRAGTEAELADPRVVRGGSFRSLQVDDGETTFRPADGERPTSRADDLGFRVVIECPSRPLTPSP